MKKIIFLFLLLGITSCKAQQVVTNQSGITTLKGIGALGGNTDKITLRRYNASTPSVYLYGAWFDKISNKKAGVGISIRNDSTQSTDGKLSATHILLRNDSLIIFHRPTYNASLNKIFTKKYTSIPIFLGVEANGNKLKVYTSTRIDGKNSIKVLDKDSIFLGWKHKTPNLIVPVFNQLSSVNVSNISIKQTTLDTTGSNVDTTTVPPTSGVLMSIASIAKNIGIQTIVNHIPLDSIGIFSIPTYTNTQGYVRPKWGVWWNFWGQPFINYRSIKYWQIGLMGQATLNPSFYHGAGIRGDDFIYPYDPNTGLSWSGNVDPVVGQTFYTFMSSIPYYHRFHEGSLDASMSLSSMGLAGAFDFGASAVHSAEFGFGDNIAGKTHRGLEAIDIEDGTADYGSPYHRAALIGMATNTTADVSSDYGVLANTVGYIHDPATNEKINYFYPNSAGVYTDSRAVFSEDWRADTPLLSIPEKGISNKRLMDYPNIVPSGEVSFYAHEFASQGATYNLGNGNSIVINKYTNNRNTEHFLARAGTLLEWNAWYARYKLNNRRFKMLTKVIADKGAIGLNQYVKLANGSFVADADTNHRALLAGREYAFDLVSLTYMNSVDLHEWDKNSFNFEKTHDTYIGFFAAIKMLMTNGGANAYLEMIPQYWETEQSYNHINWVKHKAVDWADAPSVLPCRTKVGINKFEAMCWRTEGIEPTEAWLRATVSGVVREIHITPDAWETTKPHINRPYQNSDKDYFYTIQTYN